VGGCVVNVLGGLAVTGTNGFVREGTVSDPLGSFLEGLVGEPGGAGFYGGYGFRQGIQERKRRRATEEEDRTYERARRLREDVGFQLQQRVREGQLEKTGLEMDLLRRGDGRRDPVNWETKETRDGSLVQVNPETGETRPVGLKAPARPGRGGPGAGGVDERAVISLANKLFDPEGFGESSGPYATWEEAYSEALKRYQTAGRLGGQQPPAPGAPRSPGFEIPSAVRDYIARQNRGPTGGRGPSPVQPQRPAPAAQKTPAQWVSEVRQENPDWTPEQVAAEARRRAGVR
jgi:hypothetical protein